MCFHRVSFRKLPNLLVISVFSQVFLPGALSMGGCEDADALQGGVGEQEEEEGRPSPENHKISIISGFSQGVLTKTFKHISNICVFIRFPYQNLQTYK